MDLNDIPIAERRSILSKAMIQLDSTMRIDARSTEEYQVINRALVSYMTQLAKAEDAAERERSQGRSQTVHLDP